MTANPRRCGNIAAYAAHKRRGEPVDEACQKAWRDYKNKAIPVAVDVALPRLAGAACATPAGLRLFADIGPDTVHAARETCRTCPVQRTCLQWGVLYEDEGMWGGLTRDELRRERYRYGIQRQEPHVGQRIMRPGVQRTAVAA